MAQASVILEWKAYEPIIKSTFQKLYTDKTLTDVTLACGGNKQIQAHKVVLSSSSNFFKNIFDMNRNPNTLIYLQGITYNDLVLLKRFMYLGKATVEEANVTSFVALSKVFLNKASENTRLHQNIASSVHLDLKPETLPLSINNSVLTQNQTESEQLDSDTNNLNHMAAISCIHCSFTTNKKLDLKFHLRIKHKEPKISCRFCNLKFNSVPGHKSHQIRKHTEPGKVKVFTCEYCSYSTKLACSFSLHMKKHNCKMIHSDQCD